MKLLQISTGDFIRPEYVLAVTAREKLDKWNEAKVIIHGGDNLNISFECGSYEEAINLRNKIAADIDKYFAENKRRMKS